MASIGLVLGILGAVAFLWQRRGGSFRDFIYKCTPLAWLNLLAVPFLPSLADLVPALVIFAGPFRWVIVGAVALALLWSFAPPIAFEPRPLVLTVAAFVVYAALGAWVTSVQGLGGDEPHYLVITESLLRDGDLRIENNHENRDYERFFPLPLRPHFLKRGIDRVIYSIHSPGLPALLLPAYAVGGRLGANLFMALLASLTGTAVFLLARAVSTPGVALATWVGLSFTTPFLMHGWLLYPEMAGACVVAWVLWWTWQSPGEGVGRWVWRGLAVGCLPWLHVKFVVLLVACGLALGVRLRQRPASLAAFGVPIVLSLAAWLLSFYMMYGVLDPTIPYGGAAAMGETLAWTNVVRGTLGLLADQEFGLLLYSPFYLLALVGLVPLLRRRDTRFVAAVSLLVGVAFLVATTRYYMWWGGSSVPARFLVPALPLVAPFLAAGISRLAPGPSGRVFTVVTLAASLSAACLLVAQPARLLMYNDRDGSGKLLQWLQGSAPLTSAFPSFWMPDWRAQLPALTVVAVGFLFSAAAYWTRRNAQQGRTADSNRALLLIVSFVVGIALGGRVLLSGSAIASMRRDGQLALLNNWRPSRAFDVSNGVRVPEQALLDRIRVSLYAAPGAEPADPRMWLGPLQLPAGAYEVRIALAAGGEAGEFSTWFRRTSAVAARAGADGTMVTLPLELPEGIGTPLIWIAASSQALTARVRQVELLARAVSPSTPGGPEQVRAFENVEGRPGLYLAYFDRNAFPENGVFWTRGESETRVAIVTPEATPLRLALETGAAGGTATLEIDGVPATRQLPPQTLEYLDLPRQPGKRTVRLTVKFSSGFRPSDDAKTRDTRWLGVRVRPVLR